MTAPTESELNRKARALRFRLESLIDGLPDDDPNHMDIVRQNEVRYAWYRWKRRALREEESAPEQKKEVAGMPVRVGSRGSLLAWTGVRSFADLLEKEKR